MANLTLSSTWEAGVYQLEINDPVDAGVNGNGISNLQARQLGNRTVWLRDQVLALQTQDGVQSAAISVLQATNVVEYGGRKYKGVVVISTPTTLAQATHGGQLLVVDTPGADITIMAPDVSAVNGVTYGIYNGSGASIRVIEGINSNNLLVPSSTLTLENGDFVDLMQRRISATNLQFVVQTLRRFNDYVPSGSVQAFAMSSPPSGWLACNGAAVSQTTYARLFALLGTTYDYLGNPGAGNFRLPDLRGEFVRGWDNGRGVDTGRTFGTAQAGEIQAHNHQFSGNNRVGISSTAYGSNATLAANMLAGSPTTAPISDNTGGGETRPRNVALLYCIKY